jgi:hypothetical protein
MKDGLLDRTLMRSLLLRKAALHLEIGDYLSFRQAVRDIEDAGHSHGFLAGHLSELASRIWTAEAGHFFEPRWYRGETAGGFMADRWLAETQELVSSGESWQLQTVKPFRDGPSPREQPSSLFDARWSESVLLPSLRRIVYLANLPNGIELCCASALADEPASKEVWRQTAVFEPAMQEHAHRQLWVSGQTVLVALPTGELLSFRAEDGAMLGRSEPIRTFWRVLDFCEEHGALVFVDPFRNRGEERRMGKLCAIQPGTPGASLIELPNQFGDPTYIYAKPLLDAMWRKGGLTVLLSATSGVELIRVSKVEIGWRRSIKNFSSDLLRDERPKTFGASHRESDWVPVHFVNVWIPPALTHRSGQVPMLARDTGDVLLGEFLPKYPERWSKTVIGLTANLELHDAFSSRAPCWVDAQGSTVLYGEGGTICAQSLATGCLIGYRNLEDDCSVIQLYGDSTEFKLERASRCDELDRQDFERQVRVLREQGDLGDCQGVWVDANGDMVVATYGTSSFGVSLCTGRLYYFDHPDFTWCATNALGRAIFSQRPKERGGGYATSFHQISFGQLISVQRVGDFPIGYEATRWSPNARFVAAKGVIYDLESAISPWTPTVDPEWAPHHLSILALSNCGRRALATLGGPLYVVTSGDLAAPSLTALEPIRVDLPCSDDERDYGSISSTDEYWEFTPDGLHVAGSTQSQLRFWCARTGRLEVQLKGAEGDNPKFAFSPRGDACIMSRRVLRTHGATLTADRAAHARRTQVECFTEIQRRQAGTRTPTGFWYAAAEPTDETPPRVASAIEYASCEGRTACATEIDVPLLQRRLCAVLLRT